MTLPASSSSNASVASEENPKLTRPRSGTDKKKNQSSSPPAAAASAPAEDTWLLSPTDLPQPSQKLPVAHTGSVFIPLPDGSVFLFYCYDYYYYYFTIFIIN